MGLLSVAYVFLLPAYLLAALFYNFVARPEERPQLGTEIHMPALCSDHRFPN
jgi:hypothetical protein